MVYILADNQDVTREGLRSFLKVADPHGQVLEAANYRKLLEDLRNYPRAVVVVDYSLFDFSSVSHLLNIKSGARLSTWLLFSDEPGEHFLRQLLTADPTISVALKSNSRSQLLDVLRSVSAGEVYWCDYAESVIGGDVPPAKITDTLTASEKKILHEIALGKSTKEIATEKNLSFHTVNAHRRNIYRKLQVNSVNEATRYALQAGLVDLMEYYI
ncbi:MAG: response regulator transcription factor [Porphyromonadaceae bacterium]|nr:response regulator transcription factor [Porphyromonadaceae bacterium]